MKTALPFLEFVDGSDNPCVKEFEILKEEINE
jgi:hypothetical protein